MESNRVDDLSARPKTLPTTCITSIQHSDEFGRLRSALYRPKYRDLCCCRSNDNEDLTISLFDMA
jgi:hypothetical protein